MRGRTHRNLVLLGAWLALAAAATAPAEKALSLPRQAPVGGLCTTTAAPGAQLVVFGGEASENESTAPSVRKIYSGIPQSWAIPGGGPNVDTLATVDCSDLIQGARSSVATRTVFADLAKRQTREFCCRCGVCVKSNGSFAILEEDTIGIPLPPEIDDAEGTAGTACNTFCAQRFPPGTETPYGVVQEPCVAAPLPGRCGGGSDQAKSGSTQRPLASNQQVTPTCRNCTACNSCSTCTTCAACTSCLTCSVVSVGGRCVFDRILDLPPA